MYGDIITCKECGNKSLDKNKYSPFPKVFCSTTCRVRHNSKKRYHKLKNDPEFREKCKINFQGWYSRNKKKHIEKVLTEYYKKSGKGIMVIGLGVPRTGTRSLAKLLNECKNSGIKEGGEPSLPFNLDLIKLKENLISMDTKKKYYGEVAHYYLNYIEYLLIKVKNVKVLCMFRERKSQIESFKKILDSNPFVGTNKTFPKIEGNLDFVLEKYYKNYYSKMVELLNKHSHKIKLVDVKILNSFEGQKEIFDFIGMDEVDRNYQVGIGK